ncbi:MAG: ABC transporter permease subunit, partial [Verrucomicrobiota bacterium]
LLVNENEQGTMAFLDSLPVSRNHIFLAKIVAGFLVLGVLPVVSYGVVFAFDVLARNSIEGSFPWKFILVETALQLAVGLYILSIASALSFFRRWFALMVGLVYWGYLRAVEGTTGWIGFLDPGETLKPALSEGHIHLPWRHLGAQGVASMILLVIAWLVFRTLGDRLQHTTDRFQRHPFLRALGSGLRFLVPVLLIVGGAILVKTRDGKKDGDKSTVLVDAAFDRRETAHYEFLFRKSQEEAARPLMDGADEVWRTVAAFFALPPSSERILVDLASPVGPHSAGNTNWNKIRLLLHPDFSNEKLKAVLGHETAHVFIEKLSNGRTFELFRYCRFLHEGLATHVEKKCFFTKEEAAGHRLAVAGAWSRGKVPFAVLCDDRALDASRDSTLVYTLGEAYLHALVEAHGPASVAHLIRALVRPDAPQGLKGVALWRDTMEAASLDFDRVEAAYEAACDRLLESEAEYLAKLPRITAEVVREGHEIIIKPRFTGTAPYRMICALHVPKPLGNDLRRL